MKSVLIIEAQMKQYRAPLFARLNDALRADGIGLTVAYSDPPPSEARKKDNCDLPPEYGLKVSGSWLWPNRLLHQPLFKAALTSDLVIVEQANRLILNHLLLPLARVGLRRVALWGLGENRQAGAIRVSEWYRRKTLNWASWWFAYTKGTAKYLEAHGVPASKITVVQNAVDTQEIREHIKSLTAEDRARMRAQLGIPGMASVGVFCGMLDKVKGLPFLVESSRIIKVRIPDFHLILVGGGPERATVQRLIEDLPWVHWVGPRFGKEKAEFLAISDAFLLPGRVGLAILDAFAAGLPMLTTQLRIHGPEIEYLEEGVNGLMSDHRPAAFAEAVSSVFSRSDRLAGLQAGAIASAEKYSIENMVANFRGGIRSCLGLSPSGAEVSEHGFRKTIHAGKAPDNGRRFAITTSWDDGHPLDLRIAELLAKHGLRGTFYVPLENTRSTLSAAQIRDLSSAFEVGAHTLHHLVLTTLPSDRARAEIFQSKTGLEEITGKPCKVFCFPKGRYANAHVEMLGEAGFTGARTIELLSFNRPRAEHGIAIMPTTLQACPHPTFTYVRNAAKRFRFKAVGSLLLHSHGTDWAATAVALLNHAQKSGGVFHLWGHSWEIEEYQQWQALDRVFAAMAQASRSAPCVTNSELCANGH
jgi:glycosyltransferase involved in cell wall biosynthesis/peptidoglycan/xylan/chitin deacetylase (PgdA/CDA1 family)